MQPPATPLADPADPAAPIAAAPAANADLATQPGERVAALDVVRGVAILGILVMNIGSFGLPMEAYMSPVVLDEAGVDRFAWAVQTVFFAGKFIAIFSMLFGAGLVLTADRRTARGASQVTPFLRRTLVLFLLGMAHAYLLWYGDILVSYAVLGLIVFWFRGFSPRLLLVLGVTAILANVLLLLGFGALMSLVPEALAEMNQAFFPPPDVLAEEVAIYQGSWLDQMAHRVPATLQLQLFLVPLGGAQLGGLMLVGMALWKWGVLAGRLSLRRHLLLAGACLAAGLPLSVAFAQLTLKTTEALWLFFYLPTLNMVAASLMAVGMASATAGLAAAAKLGRAGVALAAVGRMALTNYLLQTVLCTTLFYGHGLGLFGELGRAQLLAVVPCIWAANIALSLLWLGHFRFGPVEWLLRSAVYARPQPMRQATSSVPVPPMPG